VVTDDSVYLDYGNAGAPSDSEGHGRILLARARPL